MKNRTIPARALALLAAVLTLGGFNGRLNAQVTAFSYQGQLSVSNAPANGSFDLQFSVFDKAAGGNLIAGPVTNAATGVTNGVFSVQLDFGAGAFTGPARWLQLGVRSNGSTAAFSTLSPPQQVLAVPYAVTANSASNLLGVLPASQVTGNLPASQVSGTLSAAQLPASAITNNETGVTLSGTFSGNGSGLTSLNAGNLTGSVPSASLTSVPASSLTGAISTGQLPSTVVLNGQSGVTLSGSFSGNGSGLTISASQLGGTLTTAQLPGSVVLNNASGVTLSGFFSGNGSGLNSLNAGTLQGTIPPGSIGSLPAANLTGTVPSGTLAGAYPNVVQFANSGNTISGNGAGLTSLNANNLSGIIPLANLPANYFSIATNTITIVTNLGVVGTDTVASLVVTNSAVFTNVSILATNTDGQEVVISDGSVRLTGTLSGNGSGLTNASGRALADSSVTNGVNASLLSAGTTLTNFSMTFAAGAVAVVGANDTNFAQTIGTTISNYAQSGNALLSNYVAAGGTLPKAALVTNVMLVGPSTNAGGFWLTNGTLFVTNVGLANGVILSSATGGVAASNVTISGIFTGNGTGLTDGSGNPFGTAISNLALTIGLNGSNFSQTIGTTLTNFASGIGVNDTNFAKAIGVTISNYAQAGNLILSNYVAAGGTLPKGSLVSNAFLVGPSTNEGPFWVTNGSLTVTNGAVLLTNAGGAGVALNNANSGNVTFTGTATGNGAGLTSVNAAMLEGLTTNNIWLTGGNSGTVEGANFLGTVDNQALVLKVNSQQGLLLTPDGTGNGLPSLIGNPSANSVDSSSYGSVVGGGTGNAVQASAFASAIVGGNGNTISTSAYESFIGGGLANLIQSQSSNSFIGSGNLNLIQSSAGFSTIVGGYQNHVLQGAGYSSIGGGYINLINQNAGYSTVGGGQGNSIASSSSVIAGGDGNSVAASSDHGSVGGGKANSVTGSYGTVAGGSNNVATTEAFAAGTAAQAVNKGAFVWADSSGAGVQSAVADSVTFLADGGYRLFTGVGVGASLAAGQTAWGVMSDRNVKKNILPVDPMAVLEKLAQVPVDQWNYKWEGDGSVPHIGPMAQDFKKAFYPGRDDKTITTLEFDGVELAAIKGLNTKVDEQDASVKQQLSEQDLELKEQAQELKAKDAEIQSLKDRLERIERLINADRK